MNRKTIKNEYYTVHIENERTFGYVVMAGSRGGPGAVWPLYRGDAEVPTKRRGKPMKVFLSTYAQGERLNGRSYAEDFEGCVLAEIAAKALMALENRAALRAASTEAVKANLKKRKRR